MLYRWLTSVALMLALTALLFLGDVDGDLYWMTLILCAIPLGFHREVVPVDVPRGLTGPLAPIRSDDRILFTLWGVPLSRPRRLRGGAAALRPETKRSHLVSALPWVLARPLRQMVLGQIGAAPRASARPAGSPRSGKRSPGRRPSTK
jgi:hypothetical protein